MTAFKEFAYVCSQIENTSSSLEITDRVAEFFRTVDTEELPVVIHFIMGEVFPAWSEEELGLGKGLYYTSLSKVSGLPVDEIKKIVRKTGDIGKTTIEVMKNKSGDQVTFSVFFDDNTQLSIIDVYESLNKIAAINGKGSQNIKMKNMQYIFSKASPQESQYMARLVLEELRIGVGEGIVRDAIALAFDVPAEAIERGFMLTNDLGAVGLAAKKGGIEEVEKLTMELNRPIKLMLAQVTPSIKTAIEGMEEAAVEWKFDGARLQVHKDKDKVSIYSRKLENITNSLPDVVSAVKEYVNADSAILDGEAFAVDENGKPKPFQEILKRLRRKYDIEITTRDIPLTVKFFDIMYLNGDYLIDLPLIERRGLLTGCVRNSNSITVDQQVVTDDPEIGENIYSEAIRAGHEGIMIKNPQSPYTPGKRGKNWLKKKPVMETLDLVVIGGEWGYGRRTNFIGSYTLSCYDPDSGNFLPIGKVGTGLTDENLTELTGLFSDLIVVESGRDLEFKPKIVFEVAFEEIQKSTNYESGYALRFPRLVSVRDDKSPYEADTVSRVEEIYRSQRK